ncbi:MAG: TolC family protein [Gemmatimonadetes bacterium]|jgi:outer membrane protein TolC|nr:TolC family protein [Gemmatimonadota bacterium]MBP7548734.1 TolC family protein [Gemmatimonadaceae bacterium]
MNRPLQRAIAMAVLALASSRAAAQAVDTLRLSDLHRAALARDPRSAQAALLREQSSLRLANLRAERFPTFGVAAQAQHQSDVTSVSFPGAVLPYKDTYDANAGLRFRLLDPSRAPRTAVERTQLAESEARVEAALFAQRQAVNDAFFSALLLDAQRGVLADAITDLETQLRLARERVAAGASLPSEAAMLEAELLRRRQSLEEAASGRAVALAVLADLTGASVTEQASLEAPAIEGPVRAARMALDSLRARPEFAQFAAGRDAVTAREATVRALDKPKLSAFGRTGYGRPGLNMLAREFDTYWLAGVQLEWTPFDWGTIDREREAIAIQRQVLVTEERAFAERIQRAVRADLATIDRLERTVASDDAIVTLRERVLQETRLRYGEGVVTVGEFVDRETDLNTARLARATHRVELAQARARFLTTVGLEVR